MNTCLPTIYFATSSDVKFSQYCVIFADLGIQLSRAPAIKGLPVEPQADASDADSELNIIAHPLRLAARFASRLVLIPYMIEDTMLFVNAFSSDPCGPLGLPGADTKSWWRNLGAEGLLRLMEGASDRGARFVCQLGVYLGAGRYLFSRSEIVGEITLDIRHSDRAEADVPRSNPYYFHRVFCPIDASLSFAEMDGDTFSRYDYRQMCAESLLAKVEAQAIILGSDPQLSLFDKDL